MVKVIFNESICVRFLIKTEEGVCTLDIRSAELADSGEYKCVIQDFGKEGSNETKCNVKIEEFEHKFTGNLKGKKVVEDETAVFDLGVEEDDAEVKWYKDGVEIVPDGKRLHRAVDPVLTLHPLPNQPYPCRQNPLPLLYSSPACVLCTNTIPDTNAAVIE